MNNYKLYLYKPSALNKIELDRQVDFLGELLADNVNVNIKLQDISTISFTLPKIIDGDNNTRLLDVLDNYIVELWYGTDTEEDRQKIRFILVTTPASFDNGAYKYEYTGLSIEAMLENINITNWPGIDVKDYFRNIYYNKSTPKKFIDSDGLEIGITPANLNTSAYITISPVSLTVLPTDIYIDEFRKSGTKETLTGLISYDYSWDTRDSNSMKFKDGYYHIVVLNGYVDKIYIALPSNTDLEIFTGEEQSFSYHLYDNPISRLYKVGITTDEGTIVENAYINISKETPNDDDTVTLYDHNFITKTYPTKNGLTLKQILTGDMDELSYKSQGLLYQSGFFIGTISTNIAAKYRSNLEFNNITRYQAIKNLCETFAAIPVFDTFNNTVSFYEEDELGVNNGLLITYGLYLKSISKNIDSTKIGTYFIALGKDDLTINLVNPDGSSAWEDYSYYLDEYNSITVTYDDTIDEFSFDIPDNLKSRWMPYTMALNLAKWQKIRDYFHGVMLNDPVYTGSILEEGEGHNHFNLIDLYVKRDETIKAYVKKESELEAYSALKYKYKYLADYYNNLFITTEPVDNNLKLKADYYSKKYSNTDVNYPGAVQIENDFRTNILDVLYDKILDVNLSGSFANQIKYVRDILDDYKPAAIDLLPFRKELVFTDSSLDNELELLEGLYKFVDENNKPKVTLEIGIADILAAQDVNPEDKNKVLVGDRINILFKEFNIDLEAQIKELSIDFDNNSLSLVISTTRNYFKSYSTVVGNIIRKLINTNTNTVKYYNDSWISGSEASKDAQETLNAGLKADQTSFSSGPTNEDGEYGTTTDGAGTTSTSIESVDDATLIPEFSNIQKTIEHRNGMIVSTNIDDAKILKVAMGADFGFLITKSDDYGESYTKQMYIDTDGNATFSGALSAASGSFGDTTINGSNTLTIGTYSSGVSGDIKISNTNGIVARDSSDIVTFSVDISGDLIANSGNVGGWTLSDSDLSSNKMSINSGNTPYISINQATEGYGSNGIYIGYDSAAKISAVNGTASWLKWDGSGLEIKGNLSGSTGIFGTSGGERTELTSTGISIYDSSNKIVVDSNHNRLVTGVMTYATSSAATTITTNQKTFTIPFIDNLIINKVTYRIVVGKQLTTSEYPPQDPVNFVINIKSEFSSSFVQLTTGSFTIPAGENWEQIGEYSNSILPTNGNITLEGDKTLYLYVTSISLAGQDSQYATLLFNVEYTYPIGDTL